MAFGQQHPSRMDVLEVVWSCHLRRKVDIIILLLIIIIVGCIENTSCNWEWFYT